MKKLLDVGIVHENWVNLVGGHGIVINIHGWHPNPRNGHLCTKISSFLQLLLATVYLNLPFL